MISIFLYLLVQFNIGTSDSSSLPTGAPQEYVQNEDGGQGSWEDGD